MTRISSDPGDPGYAEFERCGGYVRVFLDGEELENCDLADDVEGFARVALTDDSGRIYCVPGTDEVARETRHGRVTFAYDRPEKQP